MSGMDNDILSLKFNSWLSFSSHERQLIQPLLFPFTLSRCCKSSTSRLLGSLLFHCLRGAIVRFARITSLASRSLLSQALCCTTHTHTMLGVDACFADFGMGCHSFPPTLRTFVFSSEFAVICDLTLFSFCFRCYFFCPSTWSRDYEAIPVYFLLLYVFNEFTLWLYALCFDGQLWV